MKQRVQELAEKAGIKFVNGSSGLKVSDVTETSLVRFAALVALDCRGIVDEELSGCKSTDDYWQKSGAALDEIDMAFDTAKAK